MGYSIGSAARSPSGRIGTTNPLAKGSWPLLAAQAATGGMPRLTVCLMESAGLLDSSTLAAELSSNSLTGFCPVLQNVTVLQRPPAGPAHGGEIAIGQHRTLGRQTHAMQTTMSPCSARPRQRQAAGPPKRLSSTCQGNAQP